MGSDLGRIRWGAQKGFSNSGQSSLSREVTSKQTPEGSERVCEEAKA